MWVVEVVVVMKMAGVVVQVGLELGLLLPLLLEPRTQLLWVLEVLPVRLVLVEMGQILYSPQLLPQVGVVVLVEH